MTEQDPIMPSELGAFTNNLVNKEGIKKLCEKVNSGGGGGTTYTAGDNIQISAQNVISATDTKYTAGTNVAISEQNVISATNTTYSAGANVAISDQNVISATDTKYTAGANVAISDQNVISATDTTYTAGTGISISEQNVISATGGSSEEWHLVTSEQLVASKIGALTLLHDIIILVSYSAEANYPSYLQFYFKKGTSLYNTRFSFVSVSATKGYIMNAYNNSAFSSSYTLNKMSLDPTGPTITKENNETLPIVYRDDNLSTTPGVRYYYKE